MNSKLVIDPEDDLSLFIDRRPTLQEMAAFEFARALWTDVLLNGKYHDYKDTLHNALEQTAPIILKLIRQLKAPRSIKSQITRAGFAMRIELELWMIYHREHMLPRRRITLYTCHLKCCVWKSNGDIDFKESARKMISLGYFGKRENFEIMCRFCMEDEIRSVPIDREFLRYVKPLNFRDHPLSYYWVCTLTNNYSRIPFCAFPLTEDSCLESVMFTLRDVDNWHAKEYFWDRLNEQDQIKKAVQLLSDETNPRTFLKQIICKMNANQRNSIFTEIPSDIIMILFRQYTDPEAAFNLWMRIKQSVSGYDFDQLLDWILREVDTPGSTCGEYSIPLVKKLWCSADIKLKCYVLEHDRGMLVERFFESEFVGEFDQDLQFMYDLLSSASIKFRKHVFLTHGDTLMVIEDFSRIDKIIQLCLPNASDVAKFKEVLTKSDAIRGYCFELFEKGKFAFLDKFFDKYFPSQASVIQYKKKMFEWNRRLFSSFIFEPSVWSELEKFVDSVDSDVSYAMSIKKKLVRAFRLEAFDDRTNIEQLTHLKDIVSRFLTHEETLELKTSLLIALRHILTNFVADYVSKDGEFFDPNFLKELALWCLGSEEKVSAVKQKFPLDEIFAESMRTLMRIRQDNEDHGGQGRFIFVFGRQEDIGVKKFVTLDALIKWYLVEDEEVKAYKLGKIFAFDDAEFFKDLAATAEIDEQDVRTFLIWILCNDEEQIRRFKSECGNETITSVI